MSTNRKHAHVSSSVPSAIQHDTAGLSVSLPSKIKSPPIS